MTFFYKSGIFIAIGYLLISCNNIIEYSPYDTDIETKNRNLNIVNLLNNNGIQISDTFDFAVMSDPHYYYDELADIISRLNKRKNIAFAVVCGDLTESGLAKEYQYYEKQIKKSNTPIISIIGNHDYLSNGLDIYKRIYGNSNFSFTYGEHKFIAFDDVIWEKGNKSPDFEWLEEQVENSDGHCIILTHIPPWGDQFTEEYAGIYNKIVTKPEVVLSISGHEHSFKDTIINSKRYLVAKALSKRSFYIVHIKSEKSEVETIDF